VPVETAADPVPDSKQSDAGSGCAESVKDTCPPAMRPVIMPENMTSVTGGDVSTDAGPDAVLPSGVAVHVTRSARPPPDPWPMTPDHVPVKFTAGEGVIAPRPQLATSIEIKPTNVRRIQLGIQSLHDSDSAADSNNPARNQSIPTAGTGLQCEPRRLIRLVSVC
jgi:hypothetical protein